MIGYDIAVVGGGVIGLSCALHLKQALPEQRVILVDAPTRPGIASQAAAGMLAPFAEFHRPSPLFDLCRQAYAYYPEFLAHYLRGIDQQPELDLSGTLVPSNGRFAERAREIVESASAFCEVKELSGDTLYQEEPLLRGGLVESAFLIDGGVINPIRLHRAMKEAAARAGIELLESEVAAVDRDDESGEARSLQLRTGEQINFGTLIVASGAWSASLGKLLGLDIDIIPVKGQLGRFALPADRLRHVIHCHHIYLAPRPARGILFGATMEEVGFRPGVDSPTVDFLSRRAEEMIPTFRDMTVVESWYGFRPRFPDGDPAIGWSSRIRNLLVATGHFRNGILLAPITGRIIAEEFVRGPRRTEAFHDPARLGI
jgi:glycine oxidase